jgi:hypothetical protein
VAQLHTREMCAELLTEVYVYADAYSIHHAPHPQLHGAGPSQLAAMADFRSDDSDEGKHESFVLLSRDSVCLSGLRARGARGRLILTLFESFDGSIFSSARGAAVAAVAAAAYMSMFAVAWTRRAGMPRSEKCTASHCTEAAYRASEGN